MAVGIQSEASSPRIITNSLPNRFTWRQCLLPCSGCSLVKKLHSTSKREAWLLLNREARLLLKQTTSCCLSLNFQRNVVFCRKRARFEPKTGYSGHSMDPVPLPSSVGLFLSLPLSLLWKPCQKMMMFFLWQITTDTIFPAMWLADSLVMTQDEVHRAADQAPGLFQPSGYKETLALSSFWVGCTSNTLL